MKPLEGLLAAIRAATTWLAASEVRAVRRKVKTVSFALATAEDIVVMKALVLRPRDIADIEGILDAVPNLDLKRVRTIVSQLSTALEGEDYLARFEAILHQAQQRR